MGLAVYLSWLGHEKVADKHLSFIIYIFSRGGGSVNTVRLRMDPTTPKNQILKQLFSETILTDATYTSNNGLSP